MNEILLGFDGQSVALKFPASLKTEIEALFGQLVQPGGRVQSAASTITVQESEPGLFGLRGDCQQELSRLDRTRCLCALAGEVVYALIVGLATGVVLHAGAVTRNGAAILLPGKSGAGKSCLCAWLASKGFSYITDECVVLHDDGKSFTALPRPLIIKDLSNAAVRETLKEAQSVISGPPAMLWPKSTLPYDQNARFGVIVFPRFAAGTGLSIEPLSAAETALNLTAYNANARNLPDHGLSLISAFAREVPAIAIRYGGFDQLETGFDAFLKLITDRNGLSLREVRRALALIKSRSGAAESLPTAE